MAENILLFVTGTTASGKTTLADKLSHQFGWTFIDYDDIVQPFLVGIRKRYKQDTQNLLDFYQQWRSESYSAFLSPVERNLKNCVNVIAAAPLSKELRNKSAISALKERIGTQFKVVCIHLIPDNNEHFRMLCKRNLERDKDTIATWKSFSSSFCKDDPVWDADELIVIRFKSYENIYDVAVSELHSRKII